MSNPLAPDLRAGAPLQPVVLPDSAPGEAVPDPLLPPPEHRAPGESHGRYVLRMARMGVKALRDGRAALVVAAVQAMADDTGSHWPVRA